MCHHRPSLIPLQASDASAIDEEVQLKETKELLKEAEEPLKEAEEPAKKTEKPVKEAEEPAKKAEEPPKETEEAPKEAAEPPKKKKVVETTKTVKQVLSSAIEDQGVPPLGKKAKRASKDK